MRILLVYPRCLEDRIHEEDVRALPMGIYSVGAVLKEAGHEVEIFNGYERGPQDWEGLMREFRPRVMGFSILHANRWGGLDMAARAKEIDPAVCVVFGGVGATFLWEHFLRHFEQVDYIVRGEGEYGLLELIQCLEQDRHDRLPRVSGIAFRQGKRIVKTPDRAPIRDLDVLPMPARYFDFQHLALTRGCPGRCAFCGSPRFWGRRVRAHSPEYFVNQMELLARRGISFFYVSDDTFTLNKKRVVQVCRLILARGLQVAWAAISHVRHVDEDVLRWMRKAGCIQVSYGVESGSQRIRNFLQKDLTPEEAERAFRLTARCGMLPRAYFIYGSRGETDQTIRESLDLMDRMRPLGAVFYILDVFPGTTLYEDLKKEGKISDETWLARTEDVMYFETDPDLSAEDVMGFGRTLRSGFYGRLPGYVDSLELEEGEDMAPLSADFCSRLGLTFSHGDYAHTNGIPEPERTAETLFRRALSLHPDRRAYLGLGMLKQRRGEHSEAVHILRQGLAALGPDEELALCLTVSLMKARAYEEAMALLAEYPDSAEAARYMANCCRALGDFDGAARHMDRYHRLAETAPQRQRGTP